MKQIFSLLSYLLINVNLQLIDALLLSTAYLKRRSATDALAGLPDAIASPTQRS
jgi:hypothetical protein